MKPKSLFLSILLLMINNGLCTSQSYNDSIAQELSQIKVYSEKIEFLKEASQFYKYKKWDMALKYMQMAHEEAFSEQDTLALASINVELAYLLYEIGSYDEALKKALKAHEQYTYLKNKKGIARSLNEIGTLYDILDDKTNALINLEKSLEIRLELNDPDEIWESYLNLGVFHYYSKNYDKALHYYEKALEIETNERVLVNIGEIYMEQGKLDIALSYFKKTISITGKATPGGYIEALATMNIGIVYYKKKMYNESQYYLSKSLEIANNVNTKLLLRDIYTVLIDVNVGKNDFKSAYENYRLLSGIKDSLFREKQIEEIAIMKTKFETEQKENQIQLQQLTIQRTHSRLMIVLMAVGLLAITSVFLIFSLRLKNKTKRALEQKNKLLEISNATKDKFFSIISHDLRSPVSAFRNLSTSIGGNIENYSNTQIKQLLQTLSNSADETVILLNNLLEWAKSQQNKIQVIKFPVNIMRICNKVANELSTKLKEKKIGLMLDNLDSFEANIDENIISTALRNLLTNAIKFSPIGSEIVLEAKNNGNFFVISVIDSGIGISEEDIEKLFCLDCDTKSIGSSPEKGSGLGLILSKELISLHEGSITVESELNKGSKFSIIIPHS